MRRRKTRWSEEKEEEEGERRSVRRGRKIGEESKFIVIIDYCYY